MKRHIESLKNCPRILSVGAILLIVSSVVVPEEKKSLYAAAIALMFAALLQYFWLKRIETELKQSEAK